MAEVPRRPRRDRPATPRAHHTARSNLSVENIAWKHRDAFPPRVAKAAASRLAEAGFDVKPQTQK
jgi:hypothetical protein